MIIAQTSMQATFSKKLFLQMMKSTLEGHKSSVECVEYSFDRLLSGSNDKTIRLWDVKTSKSVRAMILDSCVTSVAFHPYNPHSIFASSSTNIFEFDLRRSEVILKEFSFRSEGGLHEDDINNIDIHHNGEYIAAADDSGKVKIININTYAEHTPMLKSIHSNIANVCKFRPTFKWDLASGGADCHIKGHDFSTGKYTFDINTNMATDGASRLQMINPPFVYSISFSSNGRTLASGLGDGSVSFYDYSSGFNICRADGHGHLVSQVIFPHWNERDDRLLSCSNDGQIYVWSVPHSVLAFKSKGKKDKGKKDMKAGEKIVSELGEKVEGEEPSILLGIDHEAKPNWMATSDKDGGSVYVVDESKEIKIYSGVTR